MHRLQAIGWMAVWAGLAASTGRADARIADLRKDGARTAPGEVARISVEVSNDASGPFEGELRLKILRIGDEVASLVRPVSLAAGETVVRTLDWPVPTNDFTGYGIDVDLVADGRAIDRASHALDASSDWRRFPRYGFFSDYGPDQTEAEIERRAEEMASYHLNVVQFYDWMFTHDRLLKREADGSVAAEWTDWAGRTISAETLRRKVRALHGRGMAALAYSLMYGDSGNDRPERIEWGAFLGPRQTEWDQVDSHPRTNAFLFVMDVSNEDWRRHLFGEFREAIREIGFDGIHLDNLGGRWLYRYDSESGIDERQAFPSFLAAAKRALPGAAVLHNDVMGNYRDEIARSEADAYYQEVWGKETYQELRDVILDARTASGGEKAVVLAAYIHKHEAAPPSEWIDDAAVRLLDAAIFANGGFHLELGEGADMLVHEYFPIRHPRIRPGLRRALRSTYDVLVRYQNLLSFAPEGNLRDGTAGARISSETHALDKDARSESLWTVVKVREGEYDLVNLINLYGVDTLWRNRCDPPRTQRDIRLKVHLDRPVRKVWLATPDDGLGRPQAIDFAAGRDETGETVELTVPELEYWSLLIFDKR
jgi:dextranase